MCIRDSAKTMDMWLVDIKNDLGGGIAKAHKVMKEWYEQYNLYHWIVEENGFQKAIGQDKDIKNWAAGHGVKIEGHQTYKNKWDPVFGVTSMVPLFEQGKINIPWASPITQRKVNVYRSQLIYFSAASSKNSKSPTSKTDLVMASWFPMKRIRQTMKIILSEVDSDYTPSYSNYKMTTYDERMWER